MWLKFCARLQKKRKKNENQPEPNIEPKTKIVSVFKFQTIYIGLTRDRFTIHNS